MEKLSDFIVYMDESGDHSLTKIDPEFPVFCLAACLIRKEEYATRIAPAMMRLKFKWFGHDMVVLHEREIRKAEGEFKFLLDPEKREGFLADVSKLVEEAPFTAIAAVIRKDVLRAGYAVPYSPYDLALTFILERIFLCLNDLGASDKRVHIVGEARGDREDRDLELTFRRVADGNNSTGRQFPFTLILKPKTVNSTGLQLADLIARPIALSVLRPDQPNQAYAVLSPKIRSKGGMKKGYGLKVFP